MKLKVSLFFIVLFGSLSYVFSQSSYSEYFGKYKYMHKNDSILYRMYLPEIDKNSYHFEEILENNLLLSVNSDKKYPLILFLHGAGERGNDNLKQLTYIDSVFANERIQNENPCFVLAPQCPEERRWVEVDWGLDSHIIPDEPSISLEIVNSLIDSLIKVLPIDKNRIYITGLSMGGYGTWDYIARYPDKFAAAIPICGGGDENTAEKIVNIPIWCFHGTKDKAVKVERSRNMIEAIRAKDGTPIYTEYPDLGHFAWNRAYAENGLFEWLFNQKKNE